MSILLKRGLEANRATTPVAEGEILFSKDTGRIYIGSGSANSGGLEIKFFQLTASSISAENLAVSGVIQGTASWAQTATTLIGSVQSSSYSATASYLLGSVASASYAVTAAYVLGGTSVSASYATTSSFASTAPWTGISGKPALVSASAQFGQSDNFDVGLVSSSGMMVQNTEAISRITLVAAGGIATSDAIFSSKVSAGTLASPSATLNGHYTNWQMQTFGGSTWGASARMLMQAAGDHNEGSKPTNIIFSTVPSGSSTLQDRFKINGIGVQVTGSLGVSVAVNVAGSVTASGVLSNLTGTASYASTAATASYVIIAQTASYVVTANTASYISLTTHNNAIVGTNINSGSAQTLVSLQSSNINSGSAQTLVSLQSSGIYSSSAQTVGSLIGQNVALTTLTASLISASIISASLVQIDSLTISVSTMSVDSLIVTTGISSSLTGSVLGTASWAVNASTASYVLTAQTASYVVTAQTASYISQATALASIVGTNINSGSAQTVSSLSGQRISVADITASAGMRSLGNIGYYGSVGGQINFVASSVTSVINTIGSYYNGGSNFAPLQISAGANVQTFISGTQISDLYSSGLTITGSIIATNGFTGTASWASQARTSSYISSATSLASLQGSNINSSSAQTLVSLQSSNIYSSSAQTVASLSGQNVVVNTLSASVIYVADIHVQTITQSQQYTSGSTIHGYVLTDTHQFTGSVTITGSLNVNGSTNVSRIGVNVASPTGEIYLHTQKGVAGTPPAWTTNDVALFENISGSSTYIQTLSSNSASCGIVMSDTDLRAAGYLTYSHQLDRLQFGIGGSTKGTWNSSSLNVTGTITNTQGIGWGVTSTATATATSSLTSTSTAVQIFTGTLTQQVNLPAANLLGVGLGVMYVIKNRSNGIVTVKAAGADLIDGIATATLNNTTAVTLISDGVSEWQII